VVAQILQQQLKHWLLVVDKRENLTLAFHWDTLVVVVVTLHTMPQHLWLVALYIQLLLVDKAVLPRQHWVQQ
jgi:hypothetical protein